MMNYVWANLIFISFIFALFTQNTEALSNAVMKGADDACQLMLSIVGIICFWSGMMEIAKRAKITDALAKFFSPLLSRLFPEVDKNSPAMHYISLNISANMLGLGNAATPFGISAMKELQKLNEKKDTATNSQLLFVVLNTASIQLFPTTLCAYRAKYGSLEPFSVIPLVWITSAAALIVGITVAKLFSQKRKESPNSVINPISDIYGSGKI